MRVRIEHLAGAKAGERVELNGEVIRFGRSPENDVAFDPERDLDASGRHAELRLEGGELVLVDVGSSNGTRVNGRSITRARLASGDVVEFGTGGPRVRITRLDDAAPAGPAELAPGQKVGARTVALMIEQALAKAQQKPGTVGRGTAFMKSLVGQAVSSSTRGFKIAISLLVALLLGGTGAAIYFQRERDKGQRAERERLVAQIAALSKQIEQERAQTAEQLSKTAQERAAERADQQRRLESLSQKLNQLQKGSVGESIAAENHDAVFLLAASLGTREAPFCTGFAIQRNLLATNAHCVRAARQLLQRGARLEAIMNGDGKRRYPIARMTQHPAYRDRQLGSDVGLMQVQGELPRLVKIADTAALRRVRQGSPMYTIGFPGNLAKPSQPDATLTQGIISRVMTFEKTPGRFEETRLLQHTAYISQGTSGSPIFDSEGLVIGVNAGGFTTRQPVAIGSTRSGQVIPVLITMAAPGYNFAMRIDLLQDLLAVVGGR